MRNFTFLLVTLVSVLGIATASQAAIHIDFEIGGAASVLATTSTTITVDIYLTATGTTSVSGYQFAILYDATEAAGGAGLVNAPTHGGSAAWTSGGGGLSLNTGTGYAAAISASTLTAGTEITAADGQVLIGTLTFAVLGNVTGDIDISGCYDCTVLGNTGDGSTGSIAGGGVPFPNGSTTFNGAGVNVPESSTAALLALGLVGIAAGRRRTAARAR